MHVVFEPAWLPAIQPVLDDLELTGCDGLERNFHRFVPVVRENPSEVRALLAKYPCVHFERRLSRPDTESDRCLVPVDGRETSKRH
jgi:hypothetical protein